jgi:hypothetical protein
LTGLDLSGDSALDGATCDCTCNIIKDASALAARLGYNAVAPQDVAVKYPLPLSRFDFDLIGANRTYNGAPQSAHPVSCMEWNEPILGKLTTYYRENGSSIYTTTAPTKADRYRVYVKTTGNQTFYAQTSYLYIGTMTIFPHETSDPTLTAGNDKLTVSWRDYSTSSANVSYYRVYYRKAGSSSWQYKTYKSIKTCKVTLSNLANKHKYYVKVRAYRSVAGADVASVYTGTCKAMTR